MASECLPFICCFLKAESETDTAIFIQRFHEPNAADWSNPCRIDTPVVSQLGARTHSGVRLCVSTCPGPSPLILLTLQCFVCALNYTETNLSPLSNLSHLVGALATCRFSSAEFLLSTASFSIRAEYVVVLLFWEGRVDSLLRCLSHW